MKRIMVRYKLKQERAEENEALVRAVYAELKEKGPAGIRYATFKAADGVSYFHVASVETADGSNPLLAIAAFKAFGEKVRERCEEPPVTVELTEVGSYRFFGEG